MNDTRTVSRRGYAKVNLALGVGAPIPAPSPYAGYHPIASWMASVELFDDVEITPLESGESRYDVGWAGDAPRPSPIDWPIEKDLGVRAHRLLEGEAGKALLIHMTVRKRVPVGGGLGGGSADAAAVLMGVREAFGLTITNNRLAELAMKLGSDVAFFLDDAVPARAAIVSNLGERIERVAGVAQPIVLFFPPFGCPTGAVYKAFDTVGAGSGFEHRAAEVRRMVVRAASMGGMATDELFNDLAAPACRVEPQLRSIIDRLAGTLNVRVHVTGSGSTLFALPSSPAHAERLVRETRSAIPEVAAVATRVV